LSDQSVGGIEKSSSSFCPPEIQVSLEPSRRVAQSSTLSVVETAANPKDDRLLLIAMIRASQRPIDGNTELIECLSEYLVSFHQYLDRGDLSSRAFRARRSFLDG
jgi:hypothetical protein